MPDKEIEEHLKDEQKYLPDPAECRAAALAYLTLHDEINASPSIEDMDIRWEPFLAAADRFKKAVGFGFCAEMEDVADLLVDLIPAPDDSTGGPENQEVEEDFDWANLDPDPDAPPMAEQLEYIRSKRAADLP